MVGFDTQYCRFEENRNGRTASGEMMKRIRDGSAVHLAKELSRVLDHVNLGKSR
jgi:hypothetical protein